MNRQEHKTEKTQVKIYVPAELYSFLCQRSEILGLSVSAVVINIVRREKFHAEDLTAP